MILPIQLILIGCQICLSLVIKNDESGGGIKNVSTIEF